MAVDPRQECCAVPVRNWHIGKVVLVWVLGLGIGGLLIGFAVEDLYPFTIVLLGLGVALAGAPFVVIWKWLNAQDKKNTRPT